MTVFNNCSQYHPSEQEGSADLPSEGRSVDRFQESPPAVLCGKEGYGFLLRNYVVQHCGKCHNQKEGFSDPLFADADVDFSYPKALGISKTSWIKTVTNNSFCGPQCNLSQKGEVFKGLMEWVDHSGKCP